MPTLGVSTSGSRANRPTATPSTSRSAIVAAVDRVSDRGEPLERVLDAVGQLAPLDVCLVIDDVHELPPGSTAAELLGGLVARLPPHVHLVLAGRSAPPMSLDLRRAAGEVIDIRIDELAFTATEVDALVRSVGRDPRTEHGLGGFAGWPSLVRLALSAPDGSAPQFLWEEIVASLPVAEQRLLLALATLGWGTASDVAWVAGVGDGGCDPLVDARLESLARCVPLVSGDTDGWYRVHHLWEDAVERIFTDEERAGHQTTGPRAVPAPSGDAAHRVERAALGRRRGAPSGVSMPRPRHRRRAARRHRGALVGRCPRGGPRLAGSPVAADRPPPRPRLRRPAPRRRARQGDRRVRADGGSQRGSRRPRPRDGHRPHAR